MLALSVDPSVVPAILSLMGVFVAGYFAISAARAGMRNERFLTSNVGVSNGEGTVVEMLTTVLQAQAAHEQKDIARFLVVFDHLGVDDPFGEVHAHPQGVTSSSKKVRYGPTR